MSANLDRSSSNLNDDEETASSSGSEGEGITEDVSPSPQKQRQTSIQNQIWASVTNPQFIQKGITGGHVEYMITFGFSATNQRCIWKRFSDFHTLYKALRKTNKRIKNYTEFPKKTIQQKGGSSESFNKERCLKLDGFMKLVVSIDPIPPELSEWIRLSVPNPVANNARKATIVDSNSNSESSGGSSSFNDLSPQEQLLISVKESEELKLQQEAEETALMQARVRDRDSLSVDLDNDRDSSSSPSKSSRNRLGSLQDKITSKLNMGEPSSKREKEREPMFNAQQVDAKVNEAVFKVQETHQDAMKMITCDIERLNGEVSDLLNEKEDITKSNRDLQLEYDLLVEKSEYEHALLTSLALRTQYQVAISRLKIRIAAWERDGRDQHIRFLVEVKSDLPGYSAQPRPPPGMPPPPTSVPICGPGPVSSGSPYSSSSSSSGRSNTLSTPMLPPSNTSTTTPSNQLRRALSTNGRGGNTRVGGISMNTGPGINTLVRHRFSAFLELKTLLGVDFPLPNKTYFSLNRQELEERASALQAFLQEMVNKFSVDRVPVLMQFLGIPNYPEDLVDAALNLKDADLVDHYSNIDAVMDAVVDNQVQLQQQMQRRAQRDQQERLQKRAEQEKKMQDTRDTSSSNTSNMTNATSSSINLVEVADSDSDSDRDDSIAVL